MTNQSSESKMSGSKHDPDAEDSSFEVVVSDLLSNLQARLIAEHQSRICARAPSIIPPPDASEVDLQKPEEKDLQLLPDVSTVVQLIRPAATDSSLMMPVESGFEFDPPVTTPQESPSSVDLPGQYSEVSEISHRQLGSLASVESLVSMPHGGGQEQAVAVGKRSSLDKAAAMREARRRASFDSNEPAGIAGDDPNESEEVDELTESKQVHEDKRGSKAKSVMFGAANTLQEVEVEGEGTAKSSASAPGSGDRSSNLTARGSAALKREFHVLEVWTSANKHNHGRLSVAMTTKIKREKSENNMDEEEDLEQIMPKPYMLHPSSQAALAWEFIGIFLISYDCIMIPVSVMDPPSSWLSDTVMWWSRIFWSLNILVSCCTGYVREDGIVEMRPMAAARRYVQSWFVIDAMIVTFDWMEASGQSIGQISRYDNGLRALRMVRMVRVVKSLQVLKFITEHIRSEQILIGAALGKWIFLLVIVNHILACIWYAVGNSTDAGWVQSYNWSRTDMFAKYTHSYKWSLALFAGELVREPNNALEEIVTIVVLLFAIIGSAAFVSNITTAMTRLQIITGQQSAQLATLRRYMVDRGISRKLTLRVQQNAQHAVEEQKRNLPEEHVDLLKIISHPLLVEMHYEIYSPLLLEHPFFFYYNDINIGGIRKVCHNGVHVLRMSVGDVLFSDLEVPAYGRMFFITGGCIQYLKKKGAVQSGRIGQWLSEPVLWMDWTHCGTARARERTSLLALDADKFQSMGRAFPSDHARTYAEEFTKCINTQKTDLLTDLDTLEEQLPKLLQAAFPELEGSDSESDESSSSDESNSVEKKSSLKSDGEKKKIGFKVPDTLHSTAQSKSKKVLPAMSAKTSIMGGRASKHKKDKDGALMGRVSAAFGLTNKVDKRNSKRTSAAMLARKSLKRSPTGQFGKLCPRRVRETANANAGMWSWDEFWEWVTDFLPRFPRRRHSEEDDVVMMQVHPIPSLGVVPPSPDGPRPPPPADFGAPGTPKSALSNGAAMGASSSLH